MSSHRCSAPFCEDPADPSAAFCFRHAAMVPADALGAANQAWRAMNQPGSAPDTVSHFYKTRQLAIDAAGPEMLAKSEEDSSGAFRKLLHRLVPERKSAAGGYKGDIASVSRAQDDSFNHKKTTSTNSPSPGRRGKVGDGGLP